MTCTPFRPGKRRDVDPRVAMVPGLVTAVTLTVAFGLMALGVEWFWVAFPVGFGGVLPMATGLAASLARGERPDQSVDDAESDIARLREAYVAGEMDETEFERRVESLVEREERP